WHECRLPPAPRRSRPTYAANMTFSSCTISLVTWMKPARRTSAILWKAARALLSCTTLCSTTRIGPGGIKDVVGGSYRLRKNGDIPSSTYRGDQQINVTPAGEHAITAALGSFQVTDETYKHMWISPHVRPLLLTDNPNGDKLLAWIGPCDTSRVVAIQ